MIYMFIIIAIVLVILVLNFLYKNTNYFKNQFLDTHKFKNIPKNLEIVNLGSNQPKFSFDYSNSNILGMSWAIGPQSLDYDFRVLKNFYSHLNPKSKVLIAVCPFSFFLLNFKRNSLNYKYYNFLDSTLIENYSNITKKICLNYPILTAGKQGLRILIDSKIDNRIELEANPMNDDELKKDAKKWVDDWKKQFKIADLDNTSLSSENIENIEKNIEILRNMINFCIEQDFEPIVLILPVTKELSSLLPDKFIKEQIIDYINQANGKNIKFLNYWKDGRFEDKNLYFNSFFMNKIGRQKFTKQLLEDLN